MSEKPMCNLCKASVMVYDDAEKKWKTAGRTPGLSCVSIYRHMTENTFRVIGRKEQDGEVVINCAVIPQLKYNRATPTFHQWRDGVRTVYGLNFSTADEANTFASCMESALEMLRTGGGGSPQPPAGPSPAEIEAKRQEELERQRQERERQDKEKQERERQERELQERERQERERQERERQERERQERERQERERAENERIARERAAAAVPQAAAPAPPPPPSDGGAPPPPPPPPPPPSGAPAPPSGGSTNQGGLAAALQAAKLKKAAALERAESAPPPSSGGSGGGMDMMAELQKKMLRRRAAAQDNGDSGKPAPANITPAPKPTSNSVGDTKRPAWQKSNSNSLNASPSVSRKSSIAAEVNGARRPSFGNKKTSSSSELDQLKQEILSEMKSEMQKMKEEILEAIREMNC